MSLRWIKVKSEYFKIIIICKSWRERKTKCSVFTVLGWQRWIDEKVKVSRGNCNSTLSETVSNDKNSYFMVWRCPTTENAIQTSDLAVCNKHMCSMFYLKPYKCVVQTINELEHTANSYHFSVCRFYGDKISELRSFCAIRTMWRIIKGKVFFHDFDVTNTCESTYMLSDYRCQRFGNTKGISNILWIRIKQITLNLSYRILCHVSSAIIQRIIYFCNWVSLLFNYGTRSIIPHIYLWIYKFDAGVKLLLAFVFLWISFPNV